MRRALVAASPFSSIQVCYLQPSVELRAHQPTIKKARVSASQKYRSMIEDTHGNIWVAPNFDELRRGVGNKGSFTESGGLVMSRYPLSPVFGLLDIIRTQIYLNEISLSPLYDNCVVAE